MFGQWLLNRSCPVMAVVMLPEASIPMRRKVIQHFANMFCQRFIDLPSGYDLARFVKLGKGTAALNILDGECTYNGSPVDRFDTCNEYKEWLFRELERHSIAPDTIVHARMEIDATVSNIEIKESFGHVLRSADFSFDCRSAIQTDEKTYSSRQFEEKRWGYDYYWGMLYGDVDVKAT